jgi:hypothetical protein
MVIAAVGAATPARAAGTLTASDDAYSTGHDQPLSLAAPGVLSNDSDTFGNPTVVEDGDATHGTLLLGGDGSFTYTPDAGYVGPDAFTYHVEDVDESNAPVSSNVATVAIDVTNADPAAVDDSYTAQQDAPLTVDATAGVLPNDSDPDGDPLTASPPLTGPHHGTVDLQADGSFSYTPAPGFFGIDRFTYQADDGFGGTSDPATVTISVNATGNSVPTAVDDAYDGRQGAALTVNASHGVLANDSDPDGDTLAAYVLTEPDHGTLTLDSDGSFVYTPSPSFFGIDQFVYQVDDGRGGTSDPASVKLSVHQDHRPVAVDDDYSSTPVAARERLSIGVAQGVLANDTDPDDDTLTSEVAAGPKLGNVNLSPNGAFVYRADPGVCNATDSFTYTASDGMMSSAPASVSVEVHTPRRPTTLKVSASNSFVTFGHAATIKAHLRDFSKGSVVEIFSHRAGAPARLLAKRAPDPATHNVTVTVRPTRSASYFATSVDDCFRSPTPASKRVGVRVVGHGHMSGGGGKPTYTAHVGPPQPDGTVTFVWQRWAGHRWVLYYHAPVSLVNGRTISLSLTSGVVRGVRYRMTIRWNAHGGNVPGAAPWTYFRHV